MLEALTPSTAATRVLVVDDSAVMRQLVSRALDHEPDIDIVGTAGDGRSALDMIRLLHPDAVILDLVMPIMDGFEALAAIRRDHGRLPVIVFSQLSRATSTLEALARGATDFALKPTAAGSGLVEDQVRAALVPLIRGLHVPPATMAPLPIRGRTTRVPITAVVMAASTGGPSALTTVVTALPSDLRVPVLVVQHMPAVFTTLLADRLDARSAVSVVEASAGDPVIPGRVYLAPGAHHMAVRRNAGGVVIDVHDSPPENFCRPAADVLFRAAAHVYGAGVLAVVMTGMGHDGLAGAGAVHQAGGSVIAQGLASAVVTSMPAAIAEGGLADAVVELDGLAETITRWVGGGARPL
jgi:two-component system chemotaxis response regulator CheB